MCAVACWLCHLQASMRLYGCYGQLCKFLHEAWAQQLIAEVPQPLASDSSLSLFVYSPSRLHIHILHGQRSVANGDAYSTVMPGREPNEASG